MSKLLGAIGLFLVGMTIALHSSSEANSALALPNIRGLCTSSTSMTNTCLEASLQYRCFNYGNFSLVNPRPIRECNGAITKLINVADIAQVPVGDDERNPDDPVEKSGLLLKQILFKKDLEAIFDQPGTSKIFSAAQDDMEDSIRFGREHNLWDSINEISGRNRQATLKFIAAAIQDVSFGIWHIMYLGRKYDVEGRAKDSAQVKNLKAAQEFIQLFQINIENRMTYSAYPAIDSATTKRIDESLHPFLHHFYLPAYLASELRRSGKSDEQAFFASFLLNTGYEIVKYDSMLGSKRWPFHDPKPFNPKVQRERLQKIYTGYVGALWGVGLESYAKSFEAFSQDFAKNPYGSMRSYFEMKF